MDQKTLEQLALAAYQDDIELKEATERAKESKKVFIEALMEAHKFSKDTKAIGIVRTKFSDNNTFDAAEAFESLSKKDQKECLVTKPDPKLIQAHLTPLQKAKFMKPNPIPLKLGLELDDSVVEDQ